MFIHKVKFINYYFFWNFSNKASCSVTLLNIYNSFILLIALECIWVNCTNRMLSWTFDQNATAPESKDISMQHHGKRQSIANTLIFNVYFLNSCFLPSDNINNSILGQVKDKQTCSNIIIWWNKLLVENILENVAPCKNLLSLHSEMDGRVDYFSWVPMKKYVWNMSKCSIAEFVKRSVFVVSHAKTLTSCFQWQSWVSLSTKKVTTNGTKYHSALPVLLIPQTA